MNLNDPFGRVEQKQQRSYESLRRSLQEAGVSTPAQGDAVLKGMLRRAAVVTLLVVLITVVVAFLFPKLMAAVLVLAVIILFWLLVTTLNGYSLVRRYIQDELSKDRSS
ncbi:hypothetical protein [Sedimenticola thiotaurini]|uniref:Uncharacterized protein n=1 Tax=Sedimenticola thiotaurini TaxID=1543721 RepID=A0A0F7JRY9_9GAMM|nr:hypothetical protein [Sedimenticola thiotaurini]AKH19241.1 hypothetical protein AAY24_01530 [Sedimenticola thiotaurini]